MADSDNCVSYELIVVLSLPSVAISEKNQAELPFYRWDVKSSTRGKDGLYTYDAVGRLRDAQMLGANLSELEKFLDPTECEQLKARLKDKRKYSNGRKT